MSVVNLSFNGDTAHAGITDQINGGFTYDNMIFVASANSEGSDTVQYPATLSNVIAVTAVDANNTIASFSASGSALDLSAPGVNILSTSLPSGRDCSSGGSTATCSGTSMAAPHVSGAAALLMSRYPTWTNTQIRDRLLSTATDLGASGFDNTYGYGLVNIAAAIGMQVAISGPTLVYSGVEETWSSIVSGGQTPYAYQWYVNGTGVGTGSSVSYTPGGADFWLKLQVTDDLNLVDKDSIYGTVSSCTPPEIFC